MSGKAIVSAIDMILGHDKQKSGLHWKRIENIKSPQIRVI